jgi:ABC-type microcin C transport system duplicated ATPase subunit YejF
MIFQEPMVSLNPLHTWKNSSTKCSPAPGMRKEAARGEILDCLERTGIRNAAKRLNDFPHQLSGGERQRVMIAMACSRARTVDCRRAHNGAGRDGTGANPAAAAGTA